MRKHVFFAIRHKAIMAIALALMAVIMCLVYYISEPLALVALAPLKQRVIVIDPGHGGIDGGTNCPGFLEKDINLAIANKLKTELRKTGARVILTREGDMDLHDRLAETTTRHRRDLLARINIIKKSKPDMFLSIHINANPRRPGTSGPMVFYNKAVPASLHLATTIQESLNASASRYGFKKHSANPAEYFILNKCPYPGAIVELGFITNYREQQMLKKDAYQSELAKTLASSVVRYFTTKPHPVPEPVNRVFAAEDKGIVVYFPQRNQDSLGTEPLPGLQSAITTPDINSSIRAAVEHLLAGPSDGNLEPLFNPGARLLGLRTIDGIAELNFSREVSSFDQGSLQEFFALNALVETVCQFPGINGIKVLIEGQSPVTLGSHIDVSKVVLPRNPKLKVAIVIDDLAGSNQGLSELLAINCPLTMAVMPKRETTKSVAEMVHQKGYPVFLHLPMEPEHGKASWLGEGAITAGMTPLEAAKQFQEDLSAVPYVIGMNNHMGSKITKRRDLMKEVLKIAKSKKLIVLDSRTTEDTVIPELAREMDLPILERTVFLDEINSQRHVKNQVRKLAEIVKKQGSAVAIGHVGITGKNTAAALTEMIPWLEEQGIEPVFAWQLLRY